MFPTTPQSSFFLGPDGLNVLALPDFCPTNHRRIWACWWRVLFNTLQALQIYEKNERKSTLTQIKGFQNAHMFLQLQGRDCVQIHFINFSDIPSVPTSRPEWRADVFKVHKHVLRLQTSFICLESKILYREGNWKRAGDQHDKSRKTPQWKRADVGGAINLRMTAAVGRANRILLGGIEREAWNW